MRAWIILATAAVLYTQVYGSADLGAEINNQETPESTRSAEDSTYASPHERIEGQDTYDSEQHGNVDDTLEIMKVTKPSKNVSQNVEKTLPPVQSPPQDKFRQSLELPNSLNSLYNVGSYENHLAALQEATRAAYVQPSRGNFYLNPLTTQFQYPNVPQNDAYLQQPLLNLKPIAPQTPIQQIYFNPPPLNSYYHNTDKRIVQPFQNYRVKQLPIVGTNGNYFYDYDDGSYDPYKYGDYLYFENIQNTNHNQNYQPKRFIPRPFQQSQSSLTSPPFNQVNNNNSPQNIVQNPSRNVFQTKNVLQQAYSPFQNQIQTTSSNSNDFKGSLDDMYNYQVEAAKQYLKEIEEAQEYAKKVLAARNSPISHQSSQPLHMQAEYYDYQNQHTSFTNTEGWYTNVPKEPNHNQRKTRLSQKAPQAVEVNSLTSLQKTSSISDGNDFDDSASSYGHEEMGSGRNSSNALSPWPTATPVLLPNGFLADTEEVRKAKIAHLQLVLDTLKIMSKYKEQYPKYSTLKAVNAS